MADLPATLWATASGAGAKDGTSPADAAVSNPADADSIWTIFNAGTLAEPVTEVRLCGDYVPTATADIDNAGDADHRLLVRGRTADDTADVLIDVDADGGYFPVFTLTAVQCAEFWNIAAHNTSKTITRDAWRVIPGSVDYLVWYRCTGSDASRGWNTASVTGLHGLWVECWATGNAQGGWYSDLSTVTTCSRCVARSNTSSGFLGLRCLSGCVADGNTGPGATDCLAIMGSVLAYNDTYGALSTSAGVYSICDSVIAANGGYGVGAASYFTSLHRVAFWNNTSQPINGSKYSSHDQITLSADPFVDALGGDFTPSNTPAGKMIRRIPILSADGLFTSYVDLGPGQRRPRRVIPVRMAL